MPAYSFTFNSFQITQTRSQHKDTDYISFTLKVGIGSPQTLVKSMGDVNNGNHTVNVAFTNVTVDPSDNVVMNYMIVNSQVDRVDVETTMEKLGAATANGDSGLTFSNFTSALNTGATWFNNGLTSTFKSLCDGILAAEQDSFDYPTLVSTASANPFTQSTPHTGLQAVSGCNTQRSAYVVKWQMSGVFTVPNFVGSWADAEKLAASEGITVKPKPNTTGKWVESQGVPPGSVQNIGTTIICTLGNTPPSQ